VVLLIDDCADTQRLVSTRLRTESVEVVCAEDGASGLAIARELHPALILLDVMMPGMDGFEVLRELKDDQSTMDIPVLMVTGLNSPHDKVKAFDLGAVDYITKPFDVTELRVRVRSAMRMTRLMRMLAQRAQLDGLTGLWNRTFFDQAWLRETERAVRHDRPLSLALIDLDHFKSVNDQFGHPAGDVVIQRLAELIQRETRSSDIPCRYGGEEFAVVMPDTRPADAHHVCERIRAIFEQVVWTRHPKRRVTLSCGIAGAGAGVTLTRQEWLERADQNLYQAKHAGRNRVICTDLTERPRLRQVG
jgi:diguanylate cyclase (GGDEF)-like protein